MKTLKQMENEIVKLVKAHGFDKWVTWNNFPKVCTYLHSEVSEAFEAWRNNDENQVGEELADLFIRLMHSSHDLGYDLEAEYEAKMAKNWNRPYQHNRKV